MRNRNRSANHQADIAGIRKPLTRSSGVGALFDVISDASVTTQNDRARQAHQLLRFLIQRAVFVRLGVEREKPLDAEVPGSQQLLVHLSAIAIKIVHSPILSIYVS